ncbi:hypothetical protein [Parapedobacter koreensis]|uniref:Outer membrane protein beta-barrel domain-containing protein n=1 Tax=Parapedobacter koreensis TaxID=332977 RepID=A0A1H7Q8U8_9SPHI|nr:hypothetical protein [Parapedobacter koreensis]SEL44402.1 hypothetical protein SAMN05421740_105240 [Parapedobacter koreensis]
MKKALALRFGLLMISLWAGALSSFGQQPVVWSVSLGSGITDMRNFGYGMDEFVYDLPGSDEEAMPFRYINNPIALGTAGIAVNGMFKRPSIFGWEAGLNIRTGGFKISNDNPRQLVPENPNDPLLPRLGATETFRYWALHVPLSLTYKPFDVVGFKAGVDFYYQLSGDPSDGGDGSQSPLEMHMGNLLSASYKYPFNLGGHLGAYFPVGDSFRVDGGFFADIPTRMKFQAPSGTNSSGYDAFREMGFFLSIRYNLDF